jgi:hypothetical protein
MILLAILVAAFYTFENFRGNRAWNKYRAAKGQSLQPPALTPELEARMKASAACAKELEPYNEAFGAKISQCLSSLPSSGYAVREDLVTWAKLFSAAKAGQFHQVSATENATTIGSETDRAAAAAIVLEILQEEDPFMEKLRAACKRPDLVYPFGYDKPFNPKDDFPPCPRVFEAINFARYLRPKITAELAVGRTQQALHDLQLVLDVGESLRIQKSLIAGIGNLACQAIGLKPLWAALAERRFSNAELQQLQRMLADLNTVEELPEFLIAERNQMLLVFENLETKSDHSFLSDDLAAFRYVPRGWVKLEKLNYCKAFDDYLAAAFPDFPQHIRLRHGSESWDRSHSEGTGYGLQRVLHHKMLIPLMLPNLSEFAVNSAVNQVMTDQIRISCGLEQYFLQHGSYPENLQALVPGFIPELPKDPLSAKEYRYALDQNGRYRIWSVGANEQDDGGVPGDTPYMNASHPDWVWYYPKI